MKLSLRRLLLLFGFSFLAPLAAQEETLPDQIKFRRQAVTRMVFDSSQAIPLNSLRPAKAIDLNLMHPELLATSETQWDLKNSHLIGTSPQVTRNSVRWIGCFNPFATYDLVVQKTKGSGSTGITFLDSTNGDSLASNLHFEEGKPKSISWAVTIDGKQVDKKTWPVPPGTARESLTLRIQMAAVRVNLLLESSGRSESPVPMKPPTASATRPPASGDSSSVSTTKNTQPGCGKATIGIAISKDSQSPSK